MPKIIENLQSKLIEEAKKQIEEAGYGAMTIRSVAKACGVGVGTVYNYFSSSRHPSAGGLEPLCCRHPGSQHLFRFSPACGFVHL